MVGSFFKIAQSITGCGDCINNFCTTVNGVNHCPFGFSTVGCPSKGSATIGNGNIIRHCRCRAGNNRITHHTCDIELYLVLNRQSVVCRITSTYSIIICRITIHIHGAIGCAVVNSTSQSTAPLHIFIYYKTKVAYSIIFKRSGKCNGCPFICSKGNISFKHFLSFSNCKPICSTCERCLVGMYQIKFNIRCFCCSTIIECNTGNSARHSNFGRSVNLLGKSVVIQCVCGQIIIRGRTLAQCDDTG